MRYRSPAVILLHRDIAISLTSIFESLWYAVGVALPFVSFGIDRVQVVGFTGHAAARRWSAGCVQFCELF